MGKRPAVRFVTSIDGVVVEIASFRELSDNQLNMSIATQELVEIDGTEHVVIEQHFSVHGSNQGRDTSVTFKQVFADRPPLDYVSFLHNTEKHLLWPIIARRPGISPSMEGRVPPQRSKDTVHKYGESRSPFTTLFYSIFIASKNVEIEADERVNVLMHDFSRYRVFVFTTYLNIPSIRQGDIASLSTSTPVTNKKKDNTYQKIERESLGVDELFDKHWLLVCHLRNKMVRRVSGSINLLDAPWRDAFAALSVQFNKNPGPAQI